MWISKFFSQPKNHLEALGEVACVAFFSLLPLLILPFVDLRTHPQELTYALLWRSVDSGQLFLYAFAIFGTLIWLFLIIVRKTPFVCNFIFLLLIIAPAFLCAVMIVNDPSFKEVLDQSVVSISMIVYAIYLILYYALLICKTIEVDLKEDLEAGVDKLIDSFRSEQAR